MAFLNSMKLSLFLNASFLLLLCLHLNNHLHRPRHTPTTTLRRNIATHGCASLHDLPDSESKCRYIRTDPSCSPKGCINYLELFYCTSGHYPLVGHSLLLLWLAVLFYLLGNTAARYFCSTLEGLSTVLRLSPTIAGVTLLSLGNGAPDVFASIVSFTKSGNGDVGLNSILGGAFFVSSVVVGVIGVSVGPRRIAIDKPSFIRDVSFFLFTILALLVIIVIGKINFFGALAYVSIYLLYVCSVSVMQILKMKQSSVTLPLSVSIPDFDDLGIPLLGCVEESKPNFEKKKDQNLDQNRNWCEFSAVRTCSCYYYLNWVWYVLELPLSLPRRLTIPLVCDENWSKPYAVASASLSPLLLAALFNSAGASTTTSLVISYTVGGLSGVVLGNIAYVTTKRTSPPKRYLFPWLAGGFLMSVTWTYIIAEELVSLLVSYGAVLGIDASVLGLTILAWGNSLGDLIANVSMAVNSGPDGAQVAISGCYAGPMFYTLLGLGVPMVMSSWAEYPAAYVIPRDQSLYETIGFVIAGLLWALVILPKNNMRLGRFLGGGLLAIYSCFLFLTFARTLGILNLDGLSSIRTMF